MRSKPTPPAPSGSVRADEVLSLSELQKRFSLGYKGTALAQKLGLKTVVLGRQKFCIGRQVIQFFEQLSEQQANGRTTEE